ncbi:MULTISPECIES: hypothetical protein [Roseomonadaceae]|uniref:Uncharacterized protein n=1 Tax=Falsiroseomonas oleicola TaxID=2801474 RepID=A0ABS6H4Q4_9PROT|nr:hypothetical protein [Roseomonas oleicola]MBU8543639.1 hypothetical protein [Roseomonas oleicola]
MLQNLRTAAAHVPAGGFDAVANSPDDDRTFQQADIARWREVVRSANIRAE